MMPFFLCRKFLGCAGTALFLALVAASPAAAGPVSFGAAVNYAFFSQPHINTFSFSGANKITGNVVAGANGQNTGALNESNAIVGTAYEDAGVVGSNASTSGDLPVPVVAADRIVLPVTLIDLTNGFLTLRGGANDIFLVDSTGQLAQNGASGILLAGGISANHVLFNVEGAGEMSTMRGSTGNVVNGTILALGSNVNIATNYALQGTQGAAGFELNYQPYAPSIPEPATVMLLGLGLGLIAGRKRN
jgi:hypothetical protein